VDTDLVLSVSQAESAAVFHHFFFVSVAFMRRGPSSSNLCPQVFLVVVVVRRHPVEDQAALRHVPQTAASVRRNGTDGVPAVLPGPRRAGSEGEAGLRERNLDNRGREEEEARRPQSDRPRAVLRQQGSRVESAGQVADRLRAVHGQGTVRRSGHRQRSGHPGQPQEDEHRSGQDRDEDGEDAEVAKPASG
jgi:hypothetical protein